jgi:glycosyltransferase involved in cell wall biosynthesis
VEGVERIAFDGRYINDRYHGIGRYAFRLLEALVELAEEAYPERQFIIFCGKEPDSRFDWGKILARASVEIKAGPWPLYWPQEQFAWPGLLKQCRADLFFSPHFTAPLLARIQTIVTVHDLIFDRYPDYMPQRWARPYYRMMMHLSTQRARQIITVSRATAADLQRFYRIPERKLRVVSEGVDPNYKQIPGELGLQALQQKYRLADIFILSVGMRRPHKNLDKLVEATAYLEPETAPQLVFAGLPDPRFRDQAQEAAKRFGMDGRVRFLGWVPEADLPGLYRLARVAVCPSLIEGFGLPALEAMACGTPVITSNTSSFPEVVGDAGLQVDPQDPNALAAALKEVLQNEQRRQEMSAAGRERAAEFTWLKAAQRVSEIFEGRSG